MADYNPFSLRGKTILVTGASSGIGRAAAIECSKLGANIIISARNESRLNETLGLLEGNAHNSIICDLNCEDSIDKLVKELPEIQGLVNNAGFTKILPLKFLDKVELSGIFQVNTIDQ